jgi:hypothetical protein
MLTLNMTPQLFEECLDELLGLAAHAGMLGSEAVTAATKAYASRDARLKRRARDAKKAAELAEQKLAHARTRFLALSSR